MSATASLVEAPADLKKPSSSANSLTAPTVSERMQPTEMLWRRRREYLVRDAMKETMIVMEKQRRKGLFGIAY
ncbi:hypothetical protein QVD17_10941 [Tagetes erecta]|uniref:Uncharacterized protein n=1 Tax=Tagetes erecta TaxID=13708 RepID=A0AAD8L3T3_TARER|nr:hypothetical protein QVD17_10941 [Tagetes erecta]